MLRLSRTMAAGEQLRLFPEPAPAPPADDGDPAGCLAPPAGDDDSAATLARRLAPMLHRPLAGLTLTDNKSSILSVRPRRGGLDLRLHRSFAGVEDPLLRQVAALVDAPPRSAARRVALRAARAHFDAHFDADARVARPARVEPRGTCFDLESIRDELDRLFFGGRLAVDITWGRRPRRRRRRRSIQLGSYDARANLVRIHRALDRPYVPRYVVAAVVYHEMLHALIPPRSANGRRQLHGPDFRRRERVFPDHHRAETWLAKNLGRLLR